MGVALGCFRSCGDFLRCGECPFFSLVKGSKLLAGLVNEVGGEEKRSKKGKVEYDVPKLI